MNLFRLTGTLVLGLASLAAAAADAPAKLVNGASAAGGAASNKDAAFRFAQEGAVNVFYWIDGPFGYALSAQADRAELARVSAEVYRQLAGTPR